MKLQEASSRESSLTEQLAGITERSSQLGELPVLKTALEAAKTDIVALKKEHETEREKVFVIMEGMFLLIDHHTDNPILQVKKAIQEMKRKLDRAVKDKQRAEASAAQAQAAAATVQEAAQAEVTASQEQLLAREEACEQLEVELREYKVGVAHAFLPCLGLCSLVCSVHNLPQARATALLNAKDQELRQARTGHVGARDAEVNDLQNRLAEVQRACDDAEQALHNAQQRYEAETSDAALQHDGQLRSLQDELQAQQDAAESARRSADQWRRKHETLAAEHAAIKQPMETLRAVADKAQQEAAAAVAALATVKAEYETFRETSLRLAEAKDAEVGIGTRFVKTCM